MTETTASRASMPTWLAATIAGAFGLFYAYAVWNAVAFLIDKATNPGLNSLGWAVLLFAVLFPLIVFGAALALGLRRPPAHFAALLLAGLGLTAVFWLNIISYVFSSGASLIA
ncbi:hypothetical protein MSA03_01260 [Microbacterium saccharophilum]|nr:hypothetical protein [Microbacterium saccharophilum]GEP46618.1 hypothetical protein MSA03_01260 [Microbacterium saccharophilum]